MATKIKPNSTQLNQIQARREKLLQQAANGRIDVAQWQRLIDDMQAAGRPAMAQNMQRKLTQRLRP